MRFSLNLNKNGWFDYVRSIIFPDRCAFCGKVIPFRREVCEACRQSVSAIQPPKCLFCGAAESTCRCRKKQNFYDAITAVFKYEGKAKNGILRWKYKNAVISTTFFAKAISAVVRRDFAGIHFDLITFVPQTKKETAERGYNQGEILAGEVGRFLNIPSAPLLVKIAETERQHDLPLHRRSGNIFGVFDCANEKEIEGKTILLVDDIRTTGYTINECAKILQLYGAAAVYCAVIAAT